MLYLGIDQHGKQLTVNLRDEFGCADVVLVQPASRSRREDRSARRREALRAVVDQSPALLTPQLHRSLLPAVFGDPVGDDLEGCG